MINSTLSIHTEDLYLFNESGAVVLSRCDKSKEIKNVFSLISESSRRFIIEKARAAEPYSYLLVESEIGPLFILRSLYPFFRLFIAISPRFDADTVYALASTRKHDFFATAESAGHFPADNVDSLSLMNEHTRLFDRLDACFRGASGYWIPMLPFDKVLSELERMVLSVASLLGCELRVSFDRSVYEHREPNRFLCEGFLLSLLYFGALAKRCSADRSADVVIFAEEQGFYFTIAFDVCSDYANVDRITDSEEILALRRQIAPHAFPCCTRYVDGFFKASCFCWRSVTEGDLKTVQKLIYENHERKEGDEIWLDPIHPQ